MPRRPEYISPSALSCFESDQEAYYLRYIADDRPPREPQTPAMAVGSSFDAHVKSYLHEKVYGKGHPESAKYDLQTLFEAQVEPQNRKQCLEIGQYLFTLYKESGALSDMMIELQGAVDAPRFEFEVKGVVQGQREGVGAKKMGVPLLGKPDIRFVNSQGAHVIFDWKVNGYFSVASPMQGYIQCREPQGGGHWGRKGCHRDCMPMPYKGTYVNMAAYLDEYNVDWATQLATYSWLLGEEVGTEIVIGVDQLVGNSKKPQENGKPEIRIASHRARISSKFQFEAMQRYIKLWGILTEEPFYFFRDRSFEESAQLCKMLDGRAALLRDQNLSPEEEWVLKTCL